MESSQWKAAEDPRTGRTYYYHEITRETQWRKPTELASDEEKRAMEEKERKQKDFFAAMEANILHSLSQGQVPGSDAPKELERRKSSRRPAERPELVRTISTMDDIVLKDLIQRQPSFRNISRNPSLGPNDFGLTRSLRNSHIDSSEFDSFVSIISASGPLKALDESLNNNDDSIPELHGFLPDDIDFDRDDTGGDEDDAGKSTESSMASLGLTRQETQALRKLASITKEMIDVDKEDDGTPLIVKTTEPAPTLNSKYKKAARDLPREIELDESSSSEEESEGRFQKPSNAFQKAKDIGGRDLEFDESDEDDSDSGSNSEPTPPLKQRRADFAKTKPPVAADRRHDVRPDFTRRNTCGTLYVSSTMSAPDKDANIKVGAMAR
jgi:WW domain